MNTKGDLINCAYSRGRISGLTSSPTPEDNELGLQRLENMAEEFHGRNIDVGYNFEDDPDFNSPHNIDKKYWDAFETNLACRLLGDFGKEPITSLFNLMRSGYSFLSSSTAPLQETQYPSRQPVGNANTLRRNRWRRYYPEITAAPLSSETEHMVVDDIDDYTEHFDAYLLTGETIASYTIEASDGITIVSSSLTSPDVDYRIQADGSGTGEGTTTSEVKIVATTSDGRIETRLINFSLVTVTV
jgi:hypothetical protein